MAGASKSYLGIGQQTAKGALQETDPNFHYFRFTRGGMGINNRYIQSEVEVGADALPSDMQKAGVSSAGGFEFIPRAASIGWLLKAHFGAPAAAVADGAGWKHVFTLSTTDQFAVPYNTVRQAPGRLYGETYKDCIVNTLAFQWKAADYIRGAFGIVGGLPANEDIDWAAPVLDSSPTFIAPVTTITWPGLTNSPKVLGGSVTFSADVPLDEQFITGSYAPDDIEITSRQAQLAFQMKLDAELARKVYFDPAAGANWVAEMMANAQVAIAFKSVSSYAAGKNYQMKIGFNGDAANPNVKWAAQPLQLQAGRNVMINVTGTILSNGAGTPLSIELYNTQAAYADPA